MWLSTVVGDVMRNVVHRVWYIIILLLNTITYATIGSYTLCVLVHVITQDDVMCPPVEAWGTLWYHPEQHSPLQFFWQMLLQIFVDLMSFLWRTCDVKLLSHFHSTLSSVELFKSWRGQIYWSMQISSAKINWPVPAEKCCAKWLWNHE